MTLPGLVRRLALAAFPLAFLVPLGSPAAYATSFWVKSGGGASCTHTTLQAAINAAQSSPSIDTIYLVGSGPFTGPFTMVGGGGITVVGGVASCGATVSAGYAVVQAPSGKRPLAIFMELDGLITLRRLIITNHAGLSQDGHGGGLSFSGRTFSKVVLDDTWVTNSSTLSNGGGIYVSGGTLRLTGGSMVNANAALYGGGIAAVNDAVVEIDSSHVAANTASFDGGGIYAPTAKVHIGVSFGLGLGSAVTNNIAGDEGGGLYLGISSGASHLGSVGLTSITGNTARRGGGLYMNGAWTILHLADFSLNTASEAGGGIYVTLGGSLATESTEPQVDGFPRFTQNRAGDGSALYASGAQSSIALGSGSFYGHASKGTGTALMAASDNAALLFQGVTVSGNRTAELFAAGGGASLTLLHTAIAGNTLTRLVRWDGTGPGLRIANSALGEAEPLFSGLPAPQFLPQLSCVVNQFPSLLQGMPPGTDLSQVVAADPLFVAPERGDLHVSPKSPAVDRCAYAAGFGLHGGYDRDHNFRGFDEPFRPHAPGQTYDAGADEVVPIVWDDFEAGTFAHWTVTEPPVPGTGSNLQITTAARLGPLTSQRGLQLTLVDPASQASGDAFVWVAPNPVLGTDPTRFNGSFFLDPQGLTMSSTPGLNRVRLLTLYDNNGGAPRMAFALARSAADTWSLEVSYWPDLINGPVLAGSAVFACAATPCGNPSEWRNNHLELQWRDGNPGRLNVWRTRYLNGVPDPASRVSLFALNLPMPGARFDQLALGKIGAQSAGTFGQIFFDELSFTR